MARRTSAGGPGSGARLVAPLALAQFVASFAATNMNVAIGTIVADLDTTVRHLQTTITLFTLTMAALMIPGSRLTDVLGRKACFLAGLAVYGTGALAASLAPGIGVLMVGYSLLEGAGSALMIPPIYILITVTFEGTAARARWFGVVSGAAGLGSAAGPLLGGLITSAWGWRASFLAQALAVAVIAGLARRLEDPPRSGPRPPFDVRGTVLSAAGLVLLVLGINLTGTYGWAGGVVVGLVAAGLGVLAAFAVHLRRAERAGRRPLVHLHLFRDRTADLGLGTQTVQWLVMQGAFFVGSLYLQQVYGYDAIATGLALTPATAGVLLASAAAARLARRRSQRRLVTAGFAVTALGLGLLPAVPGGRALSFAPGLLLVGVGVGVMLTASVNVVQSAFPESDQGEISGVSRSASNLGSSLGTALVGSVLTAAAPGDGPFARALVLLGAFCVLGLGLAAMIPSGRSGTPVSAGRP